MAVIRKLINGDIQRWTFMTVEDYDANNSSTKKSFRQKRNKQLLIFQCNCQIASRCLRRQTYTHANLRSCRDGTGSGFLTRDPT